MKRHIPFQAVLNDAHTHTFAGPTHRVRAQATQAELAGPSTNRTQAVSAHAGRQLSGAGRSESASMSPSGSVSEGGVRVPISPRTLAVYIQNTQAGAQQQEQQHEYLHTATMP